ncbi:MAG: site-specific integrase [Desulfovibrionales bacterium]|nr:MAG: site-specific integrase [Desulfovibrionales bacterium]
MPKVHLRPAFVADPPLLKDGKAKVDYIGMNLGGFLLEVRSTGTATYYLRYRDKGGQIRQVKLGTPESITLEEARTRAKTLKSQTVIGFDPKRERDRMKAVPLFRDFVENQYLPYAKTYKRSWEQDQRVIEKRMIRLWGKKRMNEFTTQDLIAFQNALHQGGLKAGSVNRYMALVKYIFNLAERWEVIDKAPTRNTLRLENNARKERFLNENEMVLLLETLKQCASPVVPDIIEFLMLTGARRNEVLGMRWEELDTDKGHWTIPARRNKSKRNKVLPLSQQALDLLNRRSRASDFVFPNPDTGKPLVNIYSSWDRIRNLAGLSDVRIHDLRHSYASLLVNQGELFVISVPRISISTFWKKLALGRCHLTRPAHALLI